MFMFGYKISNRNHVHVRLNFSNLTTKLGWEADARWESSPEPQILINPNTQLPRANKETTGYEPFDRSKGSKPVVSLCARASILGLNPAPLNPRPPKS